MLGPEVPSALEFVVNKLHQDANPNKDTWLMRDELFLGKFWTKFADFRD